VNLSVIVAAFNAQKTIGPCLRGLMSELSPDDEIIVINDCSRDGTKEILEGPYYQNIKVIHLNENRGQGFCRNLGVSHAQHSCDAYVFIDSDIEVLHGSFSVIRKAYDKDQKISALTGMISLEHPFANFFSQYKNIYMNSIFSRLPEDINFLYGGVCSIRAADFIRWPEEDLLGEDTQLGLFLAAQGKKIKLYIISQKSYNYNRAKGEI
jgi:glycosyltransferase involved in cell wall biosynthesis